MKYSIIIGIVIIFFSCAKKTSNKPFDENSQQKRMKLISGLTINNGINRGTAYQDSLGTDYNIRYIPVKIKNDNNLSIKLHINFLKEYTIRLAGDNSFNIMPMKREWVIDGGEITDNMFVELEKDIDNPQVNKILKPGEEFLFGIGTRYNVGKDYVAPLPQVFFVLHDMNSNKICENLFFGNQTKSNLELGLRLIFNKGNIDERCAIISCGQISFTKD